MRMKFAKRAAQPRVCGCSNSTVMIRSRPRPSCRKKTKKKRSRRVGVRLSAPMNNLRRFISFTILLTAPLALYAGRDAATSASHTEYRAYVGNYTTKTDSKGIYEFRFDAATGKMSALELAGETK